MKRNLRKIMSVLIVLTLLLPLGGACAAGLEEVANGDAPPAEDANLVEATPSMEFKDVSPDDWFYSHVVNGVRFGIIKGTGDGRFEPNRNVTRAEFITMLGRLHEYGNETIGTPGVGAFYERYLDWAVEMGIIHGNEHGDLMPHAYVTREQMAVIAFRYIDVVGLWRYVECIDGPTIPVFFQDENITSRWARTAIETLGEMRLLAYNPEFHANYFRPRTDATRADTLAQLAIIASRIYCQNTRGEYNIS